MNKIHNYLQVMDDVEERLLEWLERTSPREAACDVVGAIYTGTKPETVRKNIFKGLVKTINDEISKPAVKELNHDEMVKYITDIAEKNHWSSRQR
jgi:hypothetical protein